MTAEIYHSDKGTKRPFKFQDRWIAGATGFKDIQDALRTTTQSQIIGSHVPRTKPPMNTYYYSGTSDEIETILHDGFVDNIEERNTGRLGVYVGDAPGEPDPEYPDDHLLEITLPGEIDTSKWRLVLPEKPCRWQEWLIPATTLNKHARVRKLRKDQWEQAWAKYKDAQRLKQ